MKLAAALVAALLAAPSCRAQTFRVGAGHDGMVDANGGTIEAFWPNGWDTLFSYSTNGGGFFARRHFSFGEVALGDSIVIFSTPGIGLAVPVRGGLVNLKRSWGEVTLFAGATGQSFTLPFVATQNHFAGAGGGATYRREFRHGFTLAGAAMTAKHESTAIASLTEKQPWWSAYVSGGILQGHGTLNFGAAASVLRFFSASASRSTLVAQNVTSTFDSYSLTAHGGPFAGGASRFVSETTSGDSLFANWRATETVNVRGMYLTAPGQKIFDVGILKRFGERVTVTPGATRTNGAWSWTLGGSFQSNAVAVAVSYEEQFLPLASKNPWQKTLLVSVNVQLPRNARAVVRTFVDPNGKPRWTAFGDKYFVGPMGDTEAGGVFPGFEKFLISGRVTDERGQGVFGAAVRLGKTLLFTDSGGFFELRVKNKTLPLLVNVSEFTAAGNWKVVEAPAWASPSAPVRIVVEKL